MKKKLVYGLVLSLSLAVAGCQTMSDIFTPAENSAQITKSQKKPKLSSKKKSAENVTQDDQQKKSEDIAVWLATYLDATRLTEDERADVIAAQTRYQINDDSNGQNLLLAILLTSSPIPADWDRAAALLAETAATDDRFLLSEWLLQIIRDKRHLTEQITLQQTELEAAKTAQRTLESELTELRQKIEALTQIEHTLIEKQVETQ